MPDLQPVAYASNSLWRQGSRAFFKDQRAAQVGDIMTVRVRVTDRAQLDNQTQRSRKAGESLAVGSLEELSVKAQRLMLICRMISPQYFVAIVLAPEGNFGKARFLARLAQPTLVAQL